MRTYALETFLATLMILVGLAFTMPGETFNLPHYELVRRWLPETLGGLFLVMVGVVRWVAILRNGWAYHIHGRSYTPLARIFGCAVGAGLWGTMAVSLETYMIATDHELIPAMLPVAICALVFEIYSASRGGKDAEALDSLGRRSRRSRMG